MPAYEHCNCFPLVVSHKVGRQRSGTLIWVLSKLILMVSEVQLKFPDDLQWFPLWKWLHHCTGAGVRAFFAVSVACTKLVS